MNPGTLLIRADASLAIGTGHVMRCLALAEAWQDAGGVAHLASSQIPEALKPIVTGRGVMMSEIASSPGSEEDARETVDCARNLSANWVAIDGDHFGSAFLTRIFDSGIPLVLIDDFANRESLPVHLIVNPTVEEDPTPYLNRRSNAQLMLGPRYILLRREFAKVVDRTAIQNEVVRILITLGGSDPENLTPKIAEALATSKEFHITVVAGPAYGRPEELAKLRASNLCLKSNPPNMKQLMEDSDLAIIAAGGTLWELLSVGCAVLSYSRNAVQASVVAELSRKGAVVDLGDTASFSSTRLLDTVRRLAASRQLRARMAILGKSLVDGRGAVRVVTAMLGLETK